MKHDLAYDFICCSVFFYLSAAELCTIIIFKYNKYTYKISRKFGL